MIFVCALLTWWLLRGGCTRSHFELGRETPLRQWYFVLRHGRVGRCQVCKSQTNMLLTYTHNKQAAKAAFLVLKGKLAQAAFLVLSYNTFAGWSSPVARQAHNLKAAGSNPAPATNFTKLMLYLPIAKPPASPKSAAPRPAHHNLNPPSSNPASHKQTFLKFVHEPSRWRKAFGSTWRAVAPQHVNHNINAAQANRANHKQNLKIKVHRF